MPPALCLRRAKYGSNNQYASPRVLGWAAADSVCALETASFRFIEAGHLERRKGREREREREMKVQELLRSIATRGSIGRGVGRQLSVIKLIKLLTDREGGARSCTLIHT